MQHKNLEQKQLSEEQPPPLEIKIQLDFLDKELKEWLPKIQADMNLVLEILNKPVPDSKSDGHQHWSTAELYLEHVTKLVKQYCSSVLDDAVACPSSHSARLFDRTQDGRSIRDYFLAEKIQYINQLMQDCVNKSLPEGEIKREKTKEEMLFAKFSDPLKALIFECEILSTHIEKRTIDKKATIIRHWKNEQSLDYYQAPKAQGLFCKIM